MKRTAIALAAAMLGIGVATASFAQGRHDEKPHGPPKTSPAAAAPTEDVEGTIALKDGGKLIILKNGTTYHTDAAGKRVRMRDGATMEAMDGTRYMMKNDAIWKAITEKGTLHPTHQ